MTEITGINHGFEECEDKSVYFTLSLYVSEEHVTSTLGRHLDADTVRDFQPGYRGSKRLRDAVEPLFNDIADRERLGAVDDFLLDSLCPQNGEFTGEQPEGRCPGKGKEPGKVRIVLE